MNDGNVRFRLVWVFLHSWGAAVLRSCSLDFSISFVKLGIDLDLLNCRVPRYVRQLKWFRFFHIDVDACHFPTKVLPTFRRNQSNGGKFHILAPWTGLLVSSSFDPFLSLNQKMILGLNGGCDLACDKHALGFDH